MNDEDIVPFPHDAEARTGGTSLPRFTIPPLQPKICSHLDRELWMLVKGISRNPKQQQESIILLSVPINPHLSTADCWTFSS